MRTLSDETWNQKSHMAALNLKQQLVRLQVRLISNEIPTAISDFVGPGTGL